MIEKRRPKIGFLGIMHGLYDEKQPEITEKQESFAKSVVSQLDDIADIDFPGAAKSRTQIEEYVRSFNEKEYDGIMIVILLYSSALRLVEAIKKNSLPLLLANIQPVPSVTKSWNWSNLTTNQGIHGAQDTANIILRQCTDLSVITEDLKSEDFKSYISDWSKAAMAAF